MSGALAGLAETSGPVASIESNVRHYCRRWPTVFARARGSWLYGEDGRAYLDCFAAAGSLNYGHSPAALTEAVIAHLRGGGLVNSLDTATVGKRALLDTLTARLLGPRNLTYRVQFTGPTGTTAVEAGLRLARKATGRRRIVALTGGYHGMTVDAMSVSDIRDPAGVPALQGRQVTRVPHEADAASTADALEALGIALRQDDPAAALILETVQGEGGARALSTEYLRAADALCRAEGVVLIVDDIQAGCGRTGPFFSFEAAGIRPDIVCLSKSLSGIGLPLSVVLIDPVLDVWSPGEYTGTFRGNELAFLTARLALDHWWSDDTLQRTTVTRAETLRDGLAGLGSLADWVGPPTGRGLMIGLPCGTRARADGVVRAAFDVGLVVETCGRSGDVVKLIPPLTLTTDEAERVVDGLDRAVRAVAARTPSGNARL